MSKRDEQRYFIEKRVEECYALRERLRKAMSCPRRFGIVFREDDDV